MASKEDINLYLFYEFGMDGEETDVSEDWPFELRNVGRITAGYYTSDVFEFSYEDETYFTLDLDGLTFYPAEGMTVEQLEQVEAGRIWLGQHEPVDLNTARIGDESVPRTPERRKAILALASRSLNTPRENIRILEGLFLRNGQTYLALVQKRDPAETYVIGSNVEPYQVGPTQASEWRQLSLAVSEMLRTGMLTF
jgi:hypothetical protein